MESARASAEIQDTERRYLEGLGATWDDFRGKKVLDIGAQDVAFARAAGKHGVEVIALDRKSDERIWKSYDMVPREGETFIEADAGELPFDDASFDAVVSHAGPFTGGERKELEKRFSEAWRVLRPGGELRFGRTFTSPVEEEKRTDALPEVPNVELQNRMQARARAFIQDIAQKYHFQIAEFRVHKRNKEGFAYCHYVLKKPLDTSVEEVE